MPEAMIFSSPKPNVLYTERQAAYIVIINNDLVAMVKGQEYHFLPGGGSLPGETPEETVRREVHEELARRVRINRKLGEAIQYFYSAMDDRHYKMAATFFAGEFLDEGCRGAGEHELSWVSVAESEQVCFHQCHGWAIRQA